MIYFIIYLVLSLLLAFVVNVYVDAREEGSKIAILYLTSAILMTILLLRFVLAEVTMP